MNDSKINFLGLEDMNIYWPSGSKQHQLQERTRIWFNTTVSAAAYNCYNTKVSNQPGGTDIITRDQLSHRSHVHVYDTLGQCIIKSFCHKVGLSLRVVSEYRPQENSGPYTVYQQHLQYYAENDIYTDSDPINKFYEDLCKLISEWIN